MAFVTIHDSGDGSERIRVDSYFNGGAYNVSFGQAGTPMRNVFLQGDDAAEFRDQFDAWETREPETPSRDIWSALIDPYL